jgi:hypothetical protein
MKNIYPSIFIIRYVACIHIAWKYAENARNGKIFTHSDLIFYKSPLRVAVEWNKAINNIASDRVGKMWQRSNK